MKTLLIVLLTSTVLQAQTETAVSFMNGSTILSSAILPSVADSHWQIVGVGDLDGDGHADLVWSNPTLNSFVVWLLNADGSVKSAALIYPPALTVPCIQGLCAVIIWHVVGVQDVNGDGIADILWQSSR